jgi:hypothetical protein
MRARLSQAGLKLGATALLAFTAGCGLVDPVPIDITFRDSLVGAGKIVQLENTSNEPVEGIEVLITAPAGDSRSFTLEELGPYTSFEIGWKKLGGWEIPVGAQVEVRARGHLLALKAQLPGGDDG